MLLPQTQAQCTFAQQRLFFRQFFAWGNLLFCLVLPKVGESMHFADQTQPTTRLVEFASSRNCVALCQQIFAHQSRTSKEGLLRNPCLVRHSWGVTCPSIPREGKKIRYTPELFGVLLKAPNKRLMKFASRCGPSGTQVPTSMVYCTLQFCTIPPSQQVVPPPFTQGRLLLRNTCQYIPTIYNAGKKYCFFIDMKQNPQGVFVALQAFVQRVKSVVVLDCQQGADRRGRRSLHFCRAQFFSKIRPNAWQKCAVPGWHGQVGAKQKPMFPSA